LSCAVTENLEKNDFDATPEKTLIPGCRKHVEKGVENRKRYGKVGQGSRKVGKRGGKVWKRMRTAGKIMKKY